MSDNKLLADYTFAAKYARYNKAKNRRETYEEAVSRLIAMHQRKFPQAALQIEATRDFLVQKKVVGSQRAMQFGGDAILEKNMRINNCSALHMNYADCFKHVHWLLLCGTGVGFSVQRHHVNNLPMIRRNNESSTFVVEDSIEGWADATSALFSSYFSGGKRPEFDFSQVRKKGAALRFGGKAPGPEPLLRALAKTEAILDYADGRQLTPLEVFDCAMHLADSVVSGGIRRSATIVLFDADEQEMLTSKTGNWFITDPQRGRANISAVITPEISRAQFSAIFGSTRQFGEPGFVFLNSKEFVLNPCAEVVMCPVLVKDPNGQVVENYTLDLINHSNRARFEKEGYSFHSGVQVCNLSEVNVAKMRSRSEFIDACVHASVLGTLQAGYTSFDYLGPVSEQIVRREALIGVSLTGTMSNALCEDSSLLEEAARTVVATNVRLASILNIKPSSRCTLVKPSGTASIVLETSAGIHPWHAKKYIRRVQADEYEELYRYISAVQPERCFKSAWGGEHARFIAFACEAPLNATTRGQLRATRHLDYVRFINQNWVRKGTAMPARLEGAHHNVSCTINVNPDEWDAVEEYLFSNKEFFTGVSLLGSSGDYDYVQAPYQEVASTLEEISGEDPSRDERIAMFNLYEELKKLPPIDLTQCVEEQDNTELLSAVACAGGQCDITFNPPVESADDADAADDAEAAESPFTEVQRAAVELLLEIARPLLRETPSVYFQIATLLRETLRR